MARTLQAYLPHHPGREGEVHPRLSHPTIVGIPTRRGSRRIGCKRLISADQLADSREKRPSPNSAPSLILGRPLDILGRLLDPPRMLRRWQRVLGCRAESQMRGGDADLNEEGDERGGQKHIAPTKRIAMVAANPAEKNALANSVITTKATSSAAIAHIVIAVLI